MSSRLDSDHAQEFRFVYLFVLLVGEKESMLDSESRLERNSKIPKGKVETVCGV